MTAHTPCHTLIIADVHLQPSIKSFPHTGENSLEHPINHAFLQFLKTLAPKADALYILGDLFEVWLGDDISLKQYPEIISEFKKLSTQGVKLYLLFGNRDFLMGDAFWQATGIQYINEPHLVTLYDKPYVMLHGDTLCTLDKGYQRMRTVFRHPWFKRLMLHLSPKRRTAMGQKLRQRSKDASLQKPQTLMDVTQDAVCDLFKAFPIAQHLIHGHTHRPGLHLIEAPHTTLKRWVLGDWRPAAFIIKVTDNGPELIEFKP
ncbi:UDP-2,3-diacylglucosamine diphosphatase [Thiomicrorhabdus aquaedulcis]|uniref:UDP-2,3-diacylglucosamine diphosphatase n=1 Tax=Thiomicrorhabdus aquaedulcis TaxID=2211106 RepID=UPI000FD96856|nr:UDP-2,3-diacylglucosamine diphosphatase [Thiomicrorhabdus aquaedulcis]